VPRAKGTIPTEETSSASRSATAQAETIIEKSAPRNPGGGARTTAEPSSVNETTGSLTAKTPVGEGQAKNGGMKALPPGQKPIAELPPGQIKPLKENLGPKPSSMTKPQAHHDMPQSLRDQFKKAGFNIEDPRFGRWVEGGPVGNHQKWSKAFNDEWRQFFETNRNPSYDDVINKTNQLRQDPRFQ